MTIKKIIISISVILIILLGTLMVVMLFRDSISSLPENIQTNSNLESNQLSNSRTSNSQNKKGETDPKLQTQTNSLLPLFDKMPVVPIFLTDEPILKTGSETQKGVAYTTCPAKDNPIIFMKKVFYQKANQKQLTNILKHELVHAWFCRQGVQAAHDERFRKKFKEVGGFGN